MKQIEIVIYMGIKERFEEFLDEYDIEEYIIIPRVHGKIKGASPKMDTHVWPGYFILYRFCMKDDDFKNFREGMLKREEEWEKEGFMATVKSIEERCGGVL